MWNVFDHGRLKNQVLVDDARFQQLYEQYQETILRAAREVDDSAVAFARSTVQITLLDQSVDAAKRSLEIATIQYREGLVDFQRVLDSQKTLFSQQERLVTSRGEVTQSLIALYKAMGGGWQAGRGRTLLDEATRTTMGDRSDWDKLLEMPLPPASTKTQLTMSEPTNNRSEEPAPASPPHRHHRPPPSGKGTRIGAIILLLLIVGSLVLYFIADRVTPSTTQARIQAFVVPVAAEVAGKVSEVKVRNNDEVEAGAVLFVIDKGPYEIALQKSKSDYETVRRTVNASVEAVGSAEAALQAAEANSKLADVDATRQERLYAEDQGAISVRRLEMAQATRVEAVSQVKKAEADLRKAKESAGDAGDRNAQLLSAKAAIANAELDLANTTVTAPVRGKVTDLQVEVGHFAQPGAPLVTLIAGNNLWISADMTENNLGHIDVGDEAEIALDILPGRVLKGRVRSIGSGVSSGQEAKPGTLPPIDNNRDWLRQAQRFPVAVEFDPAEHEALRHARIGGQAEVLVYTGDNPLMNRLSSAWLWFKSKLSYLY